MLPPHRAGKWGYGNQARERSLPGRTKLNVYPAIARDVGRGEPLGPVLANAKVKVGAGSGGVPTNVVTFKGLAEGSYVYAAEVDGKWQDASTFSVKDNDAVRRRKHARLRGNFRKL